MNISVDMNKVILLGGEKGLVCEILADGTQLEHV